LKYDAGLRGACRGLHERNFGDRRLKAKWVSCACFWSRAKQRVNFYQFAVPAMAKKRKNYPEKNTATTVRKRDESLAMTTTSLQHVAKVQN